MPNHIPTESHPQPTLSRRELLKWLGTGFGSIVLATACGNVSSLAPTPRREPTQTPTPPATNTPTEEPTPTSTPLPTSTPEPTSTPKPTSAPKPTEVPKPTLSPEEKKAQEIEKVIAGIEFKFSPEENERVKQDIREVVNRAPRSLTVNDFDQEFQNYWNNQWGKYGISLQMILDNISHDPLDAFRRVRHIGPLNECQGGSCWRANLDGKGNGTGYVELHDFHRNPPYRSPETQELARQGVLYKESLSILIDSALLRMEMLQKQPAGGIDDMYMTESSSHQLMWRYYVINKDLVPSEEWDQMIKDIHPRENSFKLLSK